MIERIKEMLQENREEFNKALEERHIALSNDDSSEAEARFVRMTYHFGACDMLKQVIQMIEEEAVVRG